jgi:hypothetical protein
MTAEVVQGTQQYFGPRDSVDYNRFVNIHTMGDKSQVELFFSYDDLPTPTDADIIEQAIPANSIILQAYYEVIVPFAGGTSYDIGLAQSDGTPIAADGLWNNLATASINAVGERGLSVGSLIGTAPAFDMYLVVAATGTYTAGVLRLVIEYAPPSTAPQI